MISKTDMERLEAAQQAVDLAQQSLAELYKSENPLLAEHAYENLETIGKIKQKLNRLITITAAK